MSSIIPPIRSIFYAVFDAKVGPKIVYQVPEDEQQQQEIISKEYFDSIASGFIITKQDLLNKLIKVTTPKVKIVGYPIEMQNKKYDRNTLYFNMCFVFDNVSHVDCLYEGVVQKLAHYLRTLEKDCDFLSNDAQNSSNQQVKDLMLRIFDDLNTHQRCSIVVNDRVSIYLIVRRWIAHPTPVNAYEVPVLKAHVDEHELATKFDVVSRKVIPFITGFNRISTISRLSQMDETVVVRCMEQFVVLGLVRMIALFQYSNYYVPTVKIAELYKDVKLKREICAKCQLSLAVEPPKFKHVFRLLCALQPGLNAKEWCQRHNPRAYNVDERKLVQYGLLTGVLRKTSLYPIYAPNQPSHAHQANNNNNNNNEENGVGGGIGSAVTVDEDAPIQQQQQAGMLSAEFERQFDGRRSLEQIAQQQEGYTYAKDLEKRLAECPNVVLLRK